MKKILKLLLITTIISLIICGLSLVCSAGTRFNDVSDNNWAINPILFCSGKNIIKPISTGMFKPADNMTRGMAIYGIVRCVYSGPLSNSVNTGFTDIPIGSEYAGAVKWAVDRGITSGTSATTFSPNAPITREAFCALLYRTFEYTGKSGNLPDDLTNSQLNSTYSDLDSISGWAEDEVIPILKAKIIEGYSDGTFRPRENVIRNAASLMLMKFYALYNYPGNAIKLFICTPLGTAVSEAKAYIFFSSPTPDAYGNFRPEEPINSDQNGIACLNTSSNQNYGVNVFRSGYRQGVGKSLWRRSNFFETVIVQLDSELNCGLPINNLNVYSLYTNSSNNMNSDLHNYMYSDKNYGYRYGVDVNGNNVLEFHQGIDIPKPYGEKVYSSTAGDVTKKGWYGECGWLVQTESLLDDGYNGSKLYYFIYQHLSSINTSIAAGGNILKSQIIGNVGGTGGAYVGATSYGNHLHFSISLNEDYGLTSRSYLDPVALLVNHEPYN